MKNNIFLFCSLVLMLSCAKEQKNNLQELNINTSNFKEITILESVDFSGLEPLLNKNDEKTYVINFWATWCLPCVKELPYFEFLNQEYKKKNVEVILVSLDFPNQKESRLIPFVNKKKLQSKIIHLDDENEQVWIAKVSEQWTGAIPATLIYNKSKSKFYEQSFTFEELKNELKQFLK